MLKSKIAILAQIALMGTSVFSADNPNLTAANIMSQLYREDSLKVLDEGKTFKIGGSTFYFRGEGPSVMSYNGKDWVPSVTMASLLSSSTKFANDLSGLIHSNFSDMNYPAYSVSVLSSGCFSFAIPLKGGSFDNPRFVKRGAVAHYPNTVFFLHASSYPTTNCNWAQIDSSLLTQVRKELRLDGTSDNKADNDTKIEAFKSDIQSKSKNSNYSDQQDNFDRAEKDASQKSVECIENHAKKIISMYQEALSKYKAGLADDDESAAAEKYKGALLDITELQNTWIGYVQKILREIDDNISAHTPNWYNRYPGNLTYANFWQAAKDKVAAYKNIPSEYLQRSKDLEILIKEAQKDPAARKAEQARKAQEDAQRQWEQQEKARKAEQARKAQEDAYRRRWQEQARKAQEDAYRQSQSSSSSYGQSGSSSYKAPKPDSSYTAPKPNPSPSYEEQAPKEQAPNVGDIRNNGGKKERWNGSKWVRL